MSLTNQVALTNASVLVVSGTTSQQTLTATGPNVIICEGTVDLTITLPLLAATPLGTLLTVKKNNGADAVTVQQAEVSGNSLVDYNGAAASNVEIAAANNVNMQLVAANAGVSNTKAWTVVEQLLQV
jgi:hypothetical protein